MHADLELAFHLADLADAQTQRWWRPEGVASAAKADGSPVTEADVAAEEAILEGVREARPGDAFLGEEVGERPGTTGRRWIVDGIDGTLFFAAGRTTWGTLLALQQDGEIVVAVSTSPAQDRRWWASRGEGSFTGTGVDGYAPTPLRVSGASTIRPERVVSLPAHDQLPDHQQQLVRRLVGGEPPDRPRSHQQLVAPGEVDLCIWYAGDIWDHAAPSLLVEEAGGRFSDHHGGKRLDTRTAIYSNGLVHDAALAALND